MSAIANASTYDRWFKIADGDQDGRVTGQDAVTFFQRSQLPKEVLAKVWDLANSQRAGFLDRLAFHKAMDLISIAQTGREITRDNYLAALEQGVPLPTMAGLETTTATGAYPHVPDGTSAMGAGSSMSADGIGRDGRVSNSSSVNALSDPPSPMAGGASKRVSDESLIVLGCTLSMWPVSYELCQQTASAGTGESATAAWSLH
eukprot:GHUV01010760.1.p1 GENE.GHUV01010760.1~~GHUV01010760.1.p1  ORF type:complete len:203 (+),score=19.42 GHUV01010760.1:417-1025(+)